MQLYSWNVNGLRAIWKKGFPEWLQQTAPDILCLQETKSHPGQLDPVIRSYPGYHTYFSAAEKKGYSGVAIYSKVKPLDVQEHWGQEAYATEGRILRAVYPDFVLYNIYFPNGRASEERLAYKMQFYHDFLIQLRAEQQQGLHHIICGDVNTAHTAIDLARPDGNADKSGFLPAEREWMDNLLSEGYVDTLRHFTDAPHLYTYWDMVTRARDRNVGWRIDYFFVSGQLVPRLAAADIHSDIQGSDHCPISITLQ